MKYRINETTGNPEAVFSAKLLSVSGKVLTMNNEKQTQYRVGTIKFEDDGGIEHTVSTMIIEEFYQKGMLIGENYQAVAAETETGVFITTWPQIMAGKADSTMFNFSEATSAAKVNEAALVAEVFAQ